MLICQSKLLGKIDLKCREVQLKVKCLTGEEKSVLFSRMTVIRRIKKL